MKESGILFTPENHRLIMSGAKVQTRRAINPQPQPPGVLTTGDGNWRVLLKSGMTKVFDWERDCPHGGVGDNLYIKEGVIVHKDEGWPKITGKKAGDLIGYYMDGARVKNVWEKRLTAMFMAKRYARTWLEITNVRVERVQEISEDDAKAEGVKAGFLTDLYYQGGKSLIDERNPMFDKSRAVNGARGAYAALWDSINGKTHPWASNPFVWCLSFKLVKP